MHNVPTTHDDAELDAYNAAFYELGLRWHWDTPTWAALQARHEDSASRVRHYLETHQPHLLRAYDPDFLVEIIEQKKCAAHRAAIAFDQGRGRSKSFDWAQARGCELGI